MTILVVDDHEFLLESVTAWLAGQHPVQGFTSPGPALAAIDGCTLLVTDLFLDGPLDGPGLIARARELRPGLPAILMTSHEPDEVDRVRLPGGVPLLHKPFSRRNLLQQVHNLLY